MPRFGLRKSFNVGRGVKAFLNLQTGTTRGEVPDPWHRNPANALKRKDKQIYKLRRNLKKHREELFQLRNRLAAAEEISGEGQGAPSPIQASDGPVGALPDYVIIGAMRCGTSRFYGTLTEHPYIKRAAAKELHYFDRPGRFENGIEWYREHFPPPEWQDGHRTITGEATPRYLFESNVPERMAQVLPDVRLIVLLRNPVDRAYSQYHRSVRNGQEDRSFLETVEQELAALAAAESSGRGLLPATIEKETYSQLARGIYVDQLARWREFFPEGQMLIIRSEDFFEDVTGILETAQDFLGLPRRELTLPTRKTTRPTNYEYGPMDPALRERLEGFFEPHNRRLYEYLGRDFGW